MGAGDDQPGVLERLAADPMVVPVQWVSVV